MEHLLEQFGLADINIRNGGRVAEFSAAHILVPRTTTVATEEPIDAGETKCKLEKC